MGSLSLGTPNPSLSYPYLERRISSREGLGRKRRVEPREGNMGGAGYLEKRDRRRMVRVSRA